ncbi:DUF4249 domain-containing protein [Larkinella rosea]|uniref:DUF4249 domain-containing protein n=1 Tax=Larkinella rosea TaxID=2025312 RepID=A0A3P1BUD8_9BACT|nr:DUF4249 domain-containing protein [Larkinella rosea]RRB04164.1 DUF4249 domain-containing protein [Larkinella rosea]
MKRLGWFLWTVFLISCQNLRQEVEPQQLADQPVKLIVACFISPQDTVLAAKVARSRPILDNETVTNLEISTATVTLQTGSRSVVLAYHSKLRYYRADPNQFPIRAGETYQLTVQTPDGQRVEATTTVPVSVQLQQIRLDSEVVLENEVQRKRLFARFFWSDAAHQTDYYAAEGIFTYRCPGCTPPKTVRQAVQFVTNRFYTDPESSAQPMVSEKGYLGVSIPINQRFFPGVFSKPFILTADLLHLSPDYYRYHEALERQQQTSTNPFAEPVPIPTNIAGGLGCFGAYNRSTMTLTLK